MTEFMPDERLARAMLSVPFDSVAVALSQSIGKSKVKVNGEKLTGRSKEWFSGAASSTCNGVGGRMVIFRVVSFVFLSLSVTLAFSV